MKREVYENKFKKVLRESVKRRIAYYEREIYNGVKKLFNNLAKISPDMFHEH
jgi:hypothetical protein